MIAILEGKNIATPESLHDALARALEFPDYYGRNLDALWDCLTGWVEGPVTIIWRDYEESRTALGEYADKVVALMREAAEEVEGLELRLE